MFNVVVKLHSMQFNYWPSLRFDHFFYRRLVRGGDNYCLHHTTIKIRDNVATNEILHQKKT